MLAFTLLAIGMELSGAAAREMLFALVKEDSVVESLTAAFYLGAAVGFAWKRNVWCLGYALLCLVAGGEEISWGQRILGIQTPESLAASNLQHEMNLHNLDGVQQHVRAAGLLILVAVMYLAPLLYRASKTLRSLADRSRMPVYPLWAVWVPTIALGLMAVPRLFFGQKDFNMDEIGEMYVALAFLLFVLSASRPEASRQQT